MNFRVFTFSLLIVTAGAAEIVLPPESASADGNSAGSFQFNGQRIQQAYVSSLFSALATEIEISEIRFRVDPNAPAFANTTDIEVRLFTTTDNPEAARSLWFNGNDQVIGLPRSQLAWSGNPGLSFDVVIPLPNRFVYDRNKGNLVIDYFMYDRGVNPTSFDVVDKPFDGISTLGGTTASQTAQLGSAGFITKLVFQPVPEIKTMWLVILGVAFILTFRTKNVTA
jgi:hypothetical protein